MQKLSPRKWLRAPGAAKVLLAILAMAVLSVPAVVFAQLNASLTIDMDCSAFAISPDGRIVYSVPHIKRVKKVIIERDEIWLSDPNGRVKRILDPDKFMPLDHPATYIVSSLAWSPDGHHIVVSMTTMAAEPVKLKQDDDDEPAPPPPGGGRDLVLLDDNGNEVKVAGLKTRFIENGIRGTYLGDGVDVAYLQGDGPYKIFRLNPTDGKTVELFEGHTFDTVNWDAKDNFAYCVGSDLSVLGKTVIVKLDLLHETVQELARLGDYRGSMRISPSGTKIGYFADGDNIEVIDLAHPAKPVRVQAGYGVFQWSHDERRLLLKRGAEDKSNSLVWIGLGDNSFTPVLHDLLWHQFQIMPDGNSIAVTEPGKRVLKIFPLQ
jgi:WD40 repeat protein